MSSSSQPLVSVVFTSYNHAEYLRQALDSLVNQTYNNLELIIIDDCSTDNSQSILIQYEHLPNVILKLNDVNSGSYVKASNYGASFAKGEFILFAQCDDYADPNQISKLVEMATANPEVAVVYSRSNLVDQNGTFISDDFSIREKKFKKLCGNNCLIPGNKMFEFLTVACVIPNLSAAIIKRKVYQKVGGLSEEYLVASDWDFWLKISQNHSFFYISESLNNFRQHNTTIRHKTKINKQLMEIFCVFEEHIERNKSDKKIKRNLLTGFGNIWFTYFLEAPYPVFLSLFSLLNKTSQKYPSMLIFFLFGILGKLKAIILK